MEFNFIELTLESKKSVSFRHCKIGLSHYPVKIIEIEQNNWPQLPAGPRQLSYFVRCHMKNDVNIQSRADPDLNSNVTQLGRICCASKICQRNENAALKTFYVRKIKTTHISSPISEPGSDGRSLGLTDCPYKNIFIIVQATVLSRLISFIRKILFFFLLKIYLSKLTLVFDVYS